MRKACVLTFREYVDQRVADLDRRNDIVRKLMYASVQQREAEMERRLTLLNDLRSEVVTDRSELVPRVAFDAVVGRLDGFLDRRYYQEQHQNLADKVDQCTADIAELRTEIASVRSRNAGMAAALGVAFTVLTIVMIIVQFATGHG